MGCGAVERVAQSVADSARGGAAPIAATGTATAVNPTPAASAPSTSKPSPNNATASKTATPATTPAPSTGKSLAVAVEPTRPTVESISMGGYDWEVVSKSEGNIRLQTKGMPTEQIAIDAANVHCKKFGRLAQMSAPRKLILFTWNSFSFNCTR